VEGNLVLSDGDCVPTNGCDEVRLQGRRRLPRAARQQRIEFQMAIKQGEIPRSQSAIVGGHETGFYLAVTWR
jgi:hypothetical protein